MTQHIPTSAYFYARAFSIVLVPGVALSVVRAYYEKRALGIESDALFYTALHSGLSFVWWLCLLSLVLATAWAPLLCVYIGLRRREWNSLLWVEGLLVTLTCLAWVSFH
jgi:hypothetical protein